MVLQTVDVYTLYIIRVQTTVPLAALLASPRYRQRIIASVYELFWFLHFRIKREVAALAKSWTPEHLNGLLSSFEGV